MARRRSRLVPQPVRPSENGFQRVLVTTDFSPRSEQALWRAVRLPLREGAELFLLHVLPKKVPGGEGGGFEKAASRAMDRVEDRLRELAEEAGRRDLLVRAELAYGNPADEIARVCRADLIELCVVGRHGASSMTDTLIGSTAERIARESPVPLLVVQSAHGGPYQRPLVAVDFGHGANRVVREALQIAPPGEGRRLHLLHAYPHPPPLRPRVTHPARRARIEEEEALVAAEKRAERFLEDWRGSGLSFELILHGADPREAILSVAETEKSDLIAVGTAGRKGMQRLLLGSVAEAVLRNASCDVLIMRAPPGEGTSPTPPPPETEAPAPV